MENIRLRPAPGDDNIAQLKQDIDSGRTGDKVANPDPDPGLSALGTDDEAGGNPATAAQVSLARRQEAKLGAEARAAVGSEASKRLWPMIIMGGVVAVLILVVVAKVFVGH